MSRSELLVEREIHGRSYGPLYETAHQLCLRHRVDGGLPQPGLFWTLKRDQDRLPILQLDRKLNETGEAGKSSLPQLKLATALLLVAAQDFEAAKHHYAALSSNTAPREVRLKALASWQSMALLEGDFQKALDLENQLGRDFPEQATVPPGLYSPQKLLGSGITGTTWLAKEIPSGRHRVIKVNPPASGDQPSFLQFCNNMLVQQMDHSAFERVLRIEPGTDGAILRVSRYRPGPSLEELVATTGPLPQPEWLGVAWSLTNGLLAAHAKGLVHKALRPGHVVLKPWGAKGTITRWRVFLHGADQLPGRTALHALLAQPELARKTALGQSAVKFANCMPPESLGKPRGPIWYGPIQDVFGMGLLSAFALTGTLHPSSLEWQAHSIDDRWKEIFEKSASWSQAPRLKNMLEFRDLLEQISGPEALAQLKAREREHSVVATAESLNEDPTDPTALAEHAEALANANRHLEAEASWTQCLEISPKHTTALTGRSFSRMHLGREKEAEIDLRLAAESQPDQAEPQALYARFLGGEQRPHDVLEFTQGAVAKHPQDLSLRVERGKAFETLGQHRKALDEFLQASRDQPSNPHLWAMIGRSHANIGAWLDSFEAWSKVLANPGSLSVEDHARFLLERAMVAENLGRISEAFADSEKAIFLDPSSMNRMVRVRLLARSGQFFQGEKEHRQVLADMAKTGTRIPALAILLWADLLNDLGRDTEGRNLVDQVLAAGELQEDGLKTVSFSPTDPGSEGAEVLAVGPGKASAPETITAQMHVTAFDIPQARFRRGMERVRQWSKSGEKSPNKRELKLALEDLRFAQKNTGPDSLPLALQSFLAMGQLYSLMEKHKQAALSFSRATNLDPSSIKALAGRSQARLEMGLKIPALEDSQKAMDLAPENKHARLIWAQCQNSLKETNTLIKALEGWQIQAPLDPDYKLLFAEVLENRGLMEQSLRVWEELLVLSPENPKALVGTARLLTILQRPEQALPFLDGPGINIPSCTASALRALNLLHLGGRQQLTQGLALLDTSDIQMEVDSELVLATRLKLLWTLGKKRQASTISKTISTLFSDKITVAKVEWLEALWTGPIDLSLIRLEKLLELDPNYTLQAAQINHWIELKLWDLALAKSSSLLKIASTESWILETRARVLACAPPEEGGNPDEAVKLARQARNSLALGSPQVDLTLAFCLAKTGSTLGQEEALEITKKVLSSIGDQYPLLLLFAQKMLPKLISRKSFIWKGPEWHRLILS